MRRAGRSIAAAIGGAAAALLLAACGTQLAAPGGGATSGSATAPAPSPTPWQTYAPSNITAAGLAEDQRTLTLTATVPDGGSRRCYRDLKAVVTDTSDRTVWVQVTYASGGVPGCVSGEATATTRIRLPSPLGRRELSVDNLRTFIADPATAPELRLCGDLGCHPAPTGCTTASYEQAMIAAGAPMHSYRNFERCGGKWLVIDFTWRTGPACGDGQSDGSADPACASSLGDRVFFHAQKTGWAPIGHSSKGGCTDVRRVEPSFPTKLCATLEPRR
jgi:hypothetical protein